MKKYIYFIGFFALHILFVSEVFSQKLILNGIDASQFPKIRASIVASDPLGNSYPNLSKNDFDVLENLKNMVASLDLTCSTTPQDLAIVMIVDVSGSMADPIDTINPNYKDTRAKWVQQGVWNFLGSVDFSRRTIASLVTFSTKPSLRQPFTKDTNKLNDSLRKNWIAGTTKYDPAFMDSLDGALQLFKNLPDSLGDLKRVIVFLTDGEPDPQPDVTTIVSECNKTNAQVFSITFMNEMNKGLQQISDQTGGKSFEVLKKEDLDKIYAVIASEIQKKSICQLTWLSPFACDDKSFVRDVEIHLKKGTNNTNTVKRSYFAPAKSVGKIDFSQKVVSFGNPPLGSPVVKSFYVIPVNSPLTIKNFDFSPNDGYFKLLSVTYKGASKTFGDIIPAGDSLLVEVEFTQLIDIGFRQANFIVNGLPCPYNNTLYGGYSNVVLLEPNGGEIYETCNAVNIKWSGVEPETPVNIYYSSDGGSNWNLIAKNQINLNYNWTKLPPAGTKYKIKLEVLATSQYRFAKSFGNDKNQYGRGITMSDDQLYLWITGWYEGQMDIGTKTLTNNGDADIFVAQLNTSGDMVNAYSAGGPGRDTATAICVDLYGNAYITGSIQKGAIFQGQSQNSIIQAGKNYFFVAKYPVGGGAPVVKLFGADNIYTSFEAWGTKIRYDNTGNGKIIVAGTAKNAGIVMVDAVNWYQFPQVATPTNFYMDFDLSLTAKAFNTGNISSASFTNDSCKSKDSAQTYKIGSFVGSKTFGTYNVTSNGLNDVWVTKYGKNQGSTDSSKSNFKIETPTLAFTKSSFNMGDAIYGDPKDSTADLILKNITSSAIQIDSTNFAITSTEFKLAKPLPTFIAPNESVNISFRFTPALTGQRLGKFNVYGNCSASITLDLIGNGVCNSSALTQIDLGKTNLGVGKTSIFKAIFTNPNQANLRINPVFINDPNNEFIIRSVTSPKYGPFTLPGPFDVKAGDVLDFEIEFKPMLEGLREAQIDYQVQSAGCVNSFTKAIGNGINSALIVNPVHFGLKRLKTLNKANLVVINTSINAAAIDSLNVTNNIFNFRNITYPISIKGKDSVLIPIEFLPNVEQLYNGFIYVRYNNASKFDTTTVDGTGSNPQLLAQIICPTNITKEGETGIATLKLTNKSINTETKIKSIRLQDPEFTFANGLSTITNVPNLSINSKPLNLNINFSPTKAGKVCTDIIFDADIALGNQVDDVYPSSTITATNQCCTAMSAGGQIPVDYGDMLACNDSTMQFPITNNSNNDLTIYGGVKFTGANPNYFTHDIINDITITPGETKFINIKFSPIEDKAYSATLDLANNQNLKIIYVLNGVGHFIKLYSSNLKDANVVPGTLTKLYVSADIPKLARGAINDLSIAVYYDDNIVKFNNDTVTTRLTNWKWNKPVKIAKNKLEISGKGILNTPFKDDLFTVPYLIYLGDIKESVLSLQNESNCTTPIDTTVNIKLSGVCFLDGRLIDFGTNLYYMSLPNPNPTNADTQIGIGLAFEAETKIEIVNYIGEVVKILENKIIKAGEYKYSIPVNELGSGVYQIRLTSGFFNKTQQLLIQK